MNEHPLVKKHFPFKYAGGGYFRRRGVEKGEKAEILHGVEALNFLAEEIENAGRTKKGDQHERES